MNFQTDLSSTPRTLRLSTYIAWTRSVIETRSQVTVGRLSSGRKSPAPRSPVNYYGSRGGRKHVPRRRDSIPARNIADLTTVPSLHSSCVESCSFYTKETFMISWYYLSRSLSFAGNEIWSECSFKTMLQFVNLEGNVFTRLVNSPHKTTIPTLLIVLLYCDTLHKTTRNTLQTIPNNHILS